MMDENLKSEALQKILQHLMMSRGKALKQKMMPEMPKDEEMSDKLMDQDDPEGVKVSSVELIGEHPEKAMEGDDKNSSSSSHDEDDFLPGEKVDAGELEELMRELGLC